MACGTFHSKTASIIYNTVKMRRKPSLRVSKTGQYGTFTPYSSKYETGVQCPLNMADIHKLSHHIAADISDCITDIPEYYVGIGSFNYNDELVSLDIIYSPTSTVPSIYS